MLMPERLALDDEPVDRLFVLCQAANYFLAVVRRDSSIRKLLRFDLNCRSVAAHAKAINLLEPDFVFESQALNLLFQGAENFLGAALLAGFAFCTDEQFGFRHGYGSCRLLRKNDNSNDEYY
jgi:hypothetical protein